MVADWIAAGLDPERSTLFVQSLVPEHAELFLLLSMIVPIPWLERVPTYKEQIEQLSEKDLSTLGFLGYPLLQTADIIIYNAHYVPVGEDQVPHLELRREIVRRYPQLLRRAVRRAAAAADDVPAPAGPRQPEDDQELRQHDRPVGRRGDGAQEGDADVHRPEAGPGGHPGHRRGEPGVHLSRRVQPGRGRGRGSEGALSRRQGRRRRGEEEAGHGAQRASRPDARAPRRGAGEARRRCARSCIEGSRKARGDRAGDDGARAQRRASCGSNTWTRGCRLWTRSNPSSRRYPVRLGQLRGAARSAAAPHQGTRSTSTTSRSRSSRSSTSTTSS